MTIAIMQPYFFPYIGYFQLMNAVDEFIVYDNIEFTKKGWINRNRVLVNGNAEYITLPLKKDSDYLDVKERFLSESWATDRIKMLNRMKESYRKAPHFEQIFPVINHVLIHADTNLFGFIYNSLKELKSLLSIPTVLSVSSEIPIDHSLKAESKVIAICNAKNASVYINPSGGIDLYSESSFMENAIELKFIKAAPEIYNQFDKPHVPFLSIIDVLMFNGVSKTREMLASYQLLKEAELHKTHQNG
jgi:hypothetical protein